MLKNTGDFTCGDATISNSENRRFSRGQNVFKYYTEIGLEGESEGFLWPTTSLKYVRDRLKLIENSITRDKDRWKMKSFFWPNWVWPPHIYPDCFPQSWSQRMCCWRCWMWSRSAAQKTNKKYKMKLKFLLFYTNAESKVTL